MANFTLNTWKTTRLVDGINWALEVDWKVNSINVANGKFEHTIRTYIVNKTSSSKSIKYSVDLDCYTCYANWGEYQVVMDDYRSVTVSANSRYLHRESNFYDYSIHKYGQVNKFVIYVADFQVLDSNSNNLITPAYGTFLEEYATYTPAGGSSYNYLTGGSYVRENGYASAMTITLPAFPHPMDVIKTAGDVWCGATCTPSRVYRQQNNTGTCSGKYRMTARLTNKDWWQIRGVTDYNGTISSWDNITFPRSDFENWMTANGTTTMTIRIYTYVNDSVMDGYEMGFREVSFTVKHTSESLPKITSVSSEVLKDITPYYNDLGNTAFQNVCRLRLNANAQTDGINNINLYEFDFGTNGTKNCNTSLASYSEVMTLTQATTFTPRVRVRATNGVYSEWKSVSSLTVYPYVRPTIPIFNLQRNTGDLSGTVELKYNCNNGNGIVTTPTLKLREQTKETFQILPTNLPSANATGTVNLTGLELGKNYIVRLEVTDNFQTTSIEKMLNANFVLMDWNKGKINEKGEITGGIGIGKMHDSGLLDVGGDVVISGKLKTIDKAEIGSSLHVSGEGNICSNKFVFKNDQTFTVGANIENGTGRIFFGTGMTTSYVARGTDASIDIMGGMYTNGRAEATSFITNSSSRFKENIQDLNEDEANKLLSLMPRKYWRTQAIEDAITQIETGTEEKGKEFYTDTLKAEHGFIAEELLALGLDEYVKINEYSGLVDGVEYSKLTVPLLQLCQKQQEEIAEMQLKQIQLEMRLNKLEEANND